MQRTRLILTLFVIGTLFTTGARAMGTIEAMQTLKQHIKSRFASDDGRVFNTEFTALTAHMEGRFGAPNRIGTAESPRLVWAIRVPADPLGNCVKVDAFKFNKNNPGLEIKVSSGKCTLYEQERMQLSNGLGG